MLVDRPGTVITFELCTLTRVLVNLHSNPTQTLEICLDNFFLRTGDGGGPLLCPGPDALDIRTILGSGTTKEKQTYYQVS